MPGDDLALAVDEIEPAGLGERHEVVREVARRGALVRVRRAVVLAALHDVARVRERTAPTAPSSSRVVLPPA